MPETSDRIQKTAEFRNMGQRCPQNIVIILGSNNVESVADDTFPGQLCCPRVVNEVAQLFLIVEFIELWKDIYVVDMMLRQKMGTYKAVRQLYNSRLACLGIRVHVIRWSRAVRRNHLQRDGVHVSDHAFVKLTEVMAQEVPTI
jgi:hypothetical protein